MDPVTAVGVAAAASQFAEQTLNVLGWLFKYVKGVVQARESAKEMRDAVLSIHRVLEELEAECDNIPATTVSSMAEDVKDFLETLNGMESRLEVTESVSLKRLRWPFTQREVERYLSKLEAYKNTFNLSLSIIQSQRARRAERHLQLIETVAQDIHTLNLENRQRLLKWIHPQSFTERHKAVCRERAANSGPWFLNGDVYLQWRDKFGPNVLCCFGIPGAGKTYIASLVIDELDGDIYERLGLGYVYFDYKEQDQQTFDRIVRVLLVQFLYRLTFLPRDLENSFAEYKCHNKEPSPNFLVDQLLSLSRNGDLGPMYLVFDALDECNDGVLKDVLNLIRRCKTAGIKVLCTTRPHMVTFIKQTLGDHLACISIAADEDDLRNYLTIRMADQWRHPYCPVEPVIDRLTKGAQGKFLLAKLQLDYIVDKETPREAMQALSTLPIDMESAYAEVVVRINRAKTSQTARRVLSWLFHAPRPLLMDELQEVISIETEPPDTKLFPEYFLSLEQVIQSCQSLVEFDTESQIVRFTHFTVEQFLRDKYQLLTKVDLAKVCSSYLTFDGSTIGISRKRYYWDFWAYYSRGPGEEDSKIFEQICAVLKRSVFLLPDTNWTPIHVFAEHGLSTLYERISAIRDHNIRINLGGVNPPSSYRSPLSIASMYGHAPMVAVLLHNGADIERRDEGYRGRTALMLAAAAQHEEVVRILLEHRAETEIFTYCRSTPLSHAIHCGHTGILKMLLEGGAFDAIGPDGNTGLLWAVGRARRGKTEHVSTIELLVRHRPEMVNAKSLTGATSLHYAALNGAEEVAKVLLDGGAAIDARTPRGWTPLMLACVSGSAGIGMTKLLLNYGADVNCQDRYGDTAFRLVMIDRNRNAWLQLLLEKGTNPSLMSRVEGTVIDSFDGLQRLYIAEVCRELIATMTGFDRGYCGKFVKVMIEEFESKNPTLKVWARRMSHYRRPGRAVSVPYTNIRSLIHSRSPTSLSNSNIERQRLMGLDGSD